MSAKEKISFVRSKEFETIDEELNSALDQLDQVNQRIVDLLSTEPAPVPGAMPEEEPAEEGAPDAAAASSGEAAGH